MPICFRYLTLQKPHCQHSTSTGVFKSLSHSITFCSMYNEHIPYPFSPPSHVLFVYLNHPNAPQPVSPAYPRAPPNLFVTFITFCSMYNDHIPYLFSPPTTFCFMYNDHIPYPFSPPTTFLFYVPRSHPMPQNRPHLHIHEGLRISFVPCTTIISRIPSHAHHIFVLCI